MTTIACDGKTVAADSKSTIGDTIAETDCVKLKVIDNVIFGLTGNPAAFNAAISWYFNGAKPADLPAGKEWSLLVFYKRHAELYHPELVYPDTFKYPCAFGSGAQYARAAFLCGADSVKAVKVATKLDVWSGGAVRSVPLIPPVKKRRKKNVDSRKR